LAALLGAGLRPNSRRATGCGGKRILAGVGEPLRTLKTDDGRTLAFAVWGDPDGFPILSLHGTPGCRLQRWPREDVYVELGVCVVTHDRAGYGRTDRRYGRRVVERSR
jgi:pimeloyl-ACP methyl ester carboxylesterase